MADEKLQVNLEKLLEQFKKDLSEQFDVIFSDKEISKSITSDKLTEIKDTVFDEIADQIEKEIKDKKEDSLDNVKKVFDNLNKKYEKQFNVLKDSYKESADKQLDEQSTIVEDKQKVLQSELIIANKLQNESIKLLESKEQAKDKRTTPIKILNKPKEESKEVGDSILIKRLDSFENKIEKRDESIKRTLDMVADKKGKTPKILDDEKDKEKQELADTEQNEQELDRIDGEIDDVIADSDSELAEIDAGKNDEDKKKLDLSEEGIISWITDKLATILEVAGIISLGLIGKVWDSFSSNESVVEKEQTETDKEIESTLNEQQKDNDKLIEKVDEDDGKPVKLSDVEQETKGLSEELSKAESEQSEENKDDDGASALENITSAEKQIDEDGETGSSGGGEGTPNLPSGFKTSSSNVDSGDAKNPNEISAKTAVKEGEDKNKEEEAKTTSELDAIEKENKKEVPVSKDYIDSEKDIAEVDERGNKIEKKGVGEDGEKKLEESDLDDADESLSQLSSDSFDIESTMGESKIDEDYTNPDENETVVEEKKIKTKVIQTDSVVLMPREQINIDEIVKTNTIENNSKLIKVTEEMNRVKNMKESLPREKTNVQITKQIFNTDELYSVLTETVAVINNLTEMVEKKLTNKDT